MAEILNYFILAVTVVLAIFLADPFQISLIANVDFTPVAWDEIPPMPVERDNLSRLNSSTLLFKGQLFGPESLAFDLEGNGPYTGISDGRIVRWMGEETGWQTFAVTSPNRTEGCNMTVPGPNLRFEEVCGRPLGLRFDKKTGDLYICDAYYGLMVVGKEGGLARSLSREAEGVPFFFTNDLDIAEDGTIYFTDTSTKYRRRQFLVEILEGAAHGRLLKYNPHNGVTTKLLQGLRFPNGVALSKDESFLIFCETTYMRCQKYWLKGPKSGTAEVFVILPGFPDNVRRNKEGHFWVAIHSRRNPVIEWVAKRPWSRKALLSLPIGVKLVYAALLGMPKGIIMRLNEDGDIVETLEDVKGSVVRAVSEVEEHDGKLWMGSVLMPHIAVFNYSFEE